MAVPINRVRPHLGTNGLAWSEDGDFAIIAVPHVIVYSPLDYNPDEKLQWSRYDIAEPDTFPINRLLEPDSPLSQSDSGPPQVTAVGWSPTGMSRAKGCFLTFLTNKHQMLIFESDGRAKQAEWKLSFDMSSELVCPLSCFDWCKVPDATLWGSARLVIGTEHMGVYVYHVSNGQFSYSEHYELDQCLKVVALEDAIWALTPTQVVKITPDNQQSWPRSAFYVSAVYGDSDGFLIAQAGQVTHYPSEQLTETSLNESVTGFLGTTQKWAIVTSKGNYFSQGFQTNLKTHLASKKSAATLMLSGVAMSPDRSAFALGYLTRPLEGLFFPSLKHKTMVIDLHSHHEPDFEQVWLSPRALWVAAHLYNSKKPSKPRFENIKVPSSIKTFESLVNDAELGKLRLETYFGVKDNTPIIRKLIANLLHDLHADSKLSPIDNAILISYGPFRDATTTTNSVYSQPIQISGGLFTEDFDFVAQRNNPAVIESATSHKWKRCNITLLPVFSVDTLASTDGTYSFLSNQANEIGDSVIGHELTSLPFCVLNGCRLHERVKK